MAYTTSADITSEFRNVTFSGSSLVTTSEVDEFISQSDAMIDAMIGKRYEVPVVGVESLKILKTISTWLVTYRVSQILAVKTATDEANQGPKGQNLFEGAMGLLKKILSGDILLSDSVTLSSTDGIESYNAENSICPEFQKGVDQY